MAGIIAAIRFRVTSRGKIAIVTLDDSYGRIDVVVGNNLLSDNYHLIKEDQLLFVDGQVSPDDFTGGNRVRAFALYDLVSIQNSKATLLSIAIKDQNQAPVIKQLLKSYASGSTNPKHKKCNVKIEYESPAGLADIMLGSQWAVTLNEDLITQLHQTFKEENVKILYN
jgi:DNA polymerase-3 subunit alpha